MRYRTMITAHSGAEGTKDNTLESIRTLLDCGADAIEVDVHMRGGVLLLNHDVPEDGVEYPSLEDCFLIVREREGLKVNIDLKQVGIVRAVYELAKKCGMEERILFTGSENDEDLRFIRENNLEIWYNDPEQATPGAPYCFHYGRVSDEMLAASRAYAVWTVDDPVQIARFLEAGVTNVTTRMPVEACRIRDMLSDFHRKWDMFPGSARLIDREHNVLAANEPARKAGFVPGVKCFSVPTGNNHRDCLLVRAFETGEGQANVSAAGMMRCWVPFADGVMLHLSFKSPSKEV